MAMMAPDKSQMEAGRLARKFLSLAIATSPFTVGTSFGKFGNIGFPNQEGGSKLIY
jgi:hypothetical protein